MVVGIKLSIAPMLELTDRHFRFFTRLLTKRTLLYTEMITTGAILHNKPEKFLEYNKEEHPIALQLGGSSPKDLAQCAKIGEDFGYDEINLNCGCPSERVQSGSFGACLMRESGLVAECVAAMQNAVKIPISVKSRIGIDNEDSWDFFLNFVETIAKTGCKYFIIHARKAWLKGLSPKENRTIPPLSYETVFKLKEAHPDFQISLNGGVKNLSEAKNILQKTDSVMIGRAAYENPWLLANADSEIFSEPYENTKNQMEILNEFLPYTEAEFKKGTPPSIITRHLMGLFHGMPGAKKYRTILSEPCEPQHGVEKIKRATATLSFH
ncbi:MAG: tRNA dihydrouridine(20/20a) synthase DusA [Fibromonadaceae bacterium]|jgi:tRNA-dihydrouridine synthase A|nr:tRNA dihydrouridine(20/20a) synthase DusA [Fibromonadaceae bacterium]